MIKEIAGFKYDCKNADASKDFYAEFLGREKIVSENGQAGLHSSQRSKFAFQKIEDYVRPIWLLETSKQQQIAHINFLIERFCQVSLIGRRYTWQI